MHTRRIGDFLLERFSFFSIFYTKSEKIKLPVPKSGKIFHEKKKFFQINRFYECKFSKRPNKLINFFSLNRLFFQKTEIFCLVLLADFSFCGIL